MLAKIEIETSDENLLRTFYSCMYRMFLFPIKLHEYDSSGQSIHFSAITGETKPGVMYVDNGFWDTLRTVYPFFAIFLKDTYMEMLEGFINIYKDIGWLPKWCSPFEVGMMPGTLIDGVFARAGCAGTIP